MNDLTRIAMLGIGATAVMDLWGLARRPLMGAPAPDYRFVGRWIGHMRSGQFTHESIAAVTPVPGERFIGWTTHYLVGIAFAAVLIAWAGMDWLQRPAIGPALMVGVGSIVAPFLIMQPAMGAGVASRRTAKPGQARLQSLLTHVAFGLGLYVAGRLLQVLSGGG